MPKRVPGADPRDDGWTRPKKGQGKKNNGSGVDADTPAMKQLRKELEEEKESKEQQTKSAQQRAQEQQLKLTLKVREVGKKVEERTKKETATKAAVAKELDKKTRERQVKEGHPCSRRSGYVVDLVTVERVVERDGVTGGDRCARRGVVHSQGHRSRMS